MGFLMSACYLLIKAYISIISSIAGGYEIMKKILITNDDGIKADGLIRLVEAAKEYFRK